MSTFFTDIQGALRVRLSTLPDLPSVAWENDTYEPDLSIYLRATILPSESFQACLGEEGLDQHSGVFQVDVFIPNGFGRTIWPDQIADHFKRDTILEQNLVKVRTSTVSILTAYKSENFYIVPVSIPYRAFTQARSV